MRETGEHSTWRRGRAMQDARGRGHNCRQRPSKQRGEEAWSWRSAGTGVNLDKTFCLVLRLEA